MQPQHTLRIDQYIVSRAKQLMDSQPNMTVQQVAYELGFCEPSSFHHFFKRVTGTTAKAYKDSLHPSIQ